MSDIEISIVKAMNARGYTAQDVCGYLFRPGRSLNPAGVYEIKSGNFGKKIPAASNEQLEQWLEEHPLRNLNETNKISLRDKLRQLLNVRINNDRIFSEPSESSQLEFKENFDNNNIPLYLKTMAGYSNNQGGYLIFGVNDQKEIIGLNDDRFNKLRPEKFSDIMKATLSPNIKWETFDMSVSRKKIGVLYCHESTHKPVITIANKNPIKADTIYYRYEGQTSAAKFSEIEIMIREREQNAVNNIASKIQQLSGIGLEKSAVVDLDTGSILTSSEAKNSPIGDRYEENKEIPTRFLITKGSITDKEILRAFIEGRLVNDPLSYILHASRESVQWLPIFYYAIKTSLNKDELIAQLNNYTESKHSARNYILERIQSNKTAYNPTCGNTVIDMKNDIINETYINIKSKSDARKFSQALSSMEDNDKKIPKVLRAALSKGLTLQQEFNDPNIGSHLRRSSARVDEILYSRNLK